MAARSRRLIPAALLLAVLCGPLALAPALVSASYSLVAAVAAPSPAGQARGRDAAQPQLVPAGVSLAAAVMDPAPAAQAGASETARSQLVRGSDSLAAAAVETGQVGHAGAPASAQRRLVRAAYSLAAAVTVPAQAAQDPAGAAAPRRIVSLVPALTEILFAIGAGPRVVAVSSFDSYPPEVKQLPRVGALLDPDMERILALRPELVVIYGSQSELQQQFGRARVATFVYRHGGIQTVLETIRELGAATGHDEAAARLVRDLQSRLDAIRARVKGRQRPRVLLVFERQPRSLREIYASGGRGFLHEMLEIAGGQNVFADVARESVQPSLETILARAPEIILEVRAEGLIAERMVAGEREVWSAVGSVPAVRNGRVHFLSGDYLVVPGPRLADATEALARVLHSAAFK